MGRRVPLLYVLLFTVTATRGLTGLTGPGPHNGSQPQNGHFKFIALIEQ